MGAMAVRVSPTQTFAGPSAARAAHASVRSLGPTPQGEARALLRQIAKLYGTQACESASDMQDLEWDPEPAGSKHGSWGLGGFWQALPTPCPAMAPATAYCEYPEGSLCQKAAVSAPFAVCERKVSGRRAGEDRGRAVRCAILPRRRCAADFGLVGPTLRPTTQ